MPALGAAWLLGCENPQPPALCGALSEQIVFTGETKTVQACFDDPNGDALVYTVATSDPGVATAAASGSTVAVKAVSPGTALVTVTATDAGGLEAAEVFQVVVPNRAPEAAGMIPSLELRVGDSAAVDVSAQFRDPDEQELTYTAALSDTSVAAVSRAGGVITITGRAKGSATLTAMATDPGGLTATQTFVVTVPNRAPETIDSIPEQTVEVGDTVTHELAGYFSDPDGDPLVYAAAASDSVLVGVHISGSTVSIAAIAKGQVSATVTATDTEGLTAALTFTVTVPNRVPVAVGTIPTDTVAVAATAIVDPSGYFSDPDGDALTYAAAVSDPAVVEAAVSGGDVTVTGIAKGQASVTVTATDTEGLTATQMFTVTVPNRAPVVVGTIRAQELEEGDSLKVNAASYFSDPDGDDLEFAAASSDSGAVSAGVSGAKVTVRAVAEGAATVTITATDPGDSTATQAFSVTVSDSAEAPRPAAMCEGGYADEFPCRGLQVFDLTRLRNVEDPPMTFSATMTYTRIRSAHNIVINEATGFAYSVGGGGGDDTCGGGLHMIDISTPSAPKFKGCFAHDSTGGKGTGYTHDAMCVVYRGPDTEHRNEEVCFGANETDLSIADVSDKDDPVALASASYPNVGYAHQGWIDGDHEYFYMNDELDENSTDSRTRTLVWDVKDLDDPVVVKEFTHTTSATDHNLYVVGDLMYQSNYNAGLRILSIANRRSPVEIAFFDTEPGQDGRGFDGSWSNSPFFASGVIAVTSQEGGVLFVRRAKEQ